MMLFCLLLLHVGSMACPHVLGVFGRLLSTASTRCGVARLALQFAAKAELARYYSREIHRLNW